MARDTIVKVIDGLEYSFYQLPAKQSMRLLIRIFRIVGAPAGAAMNGARGGADMKTLLDADLDVSGIMAALCDRLDEGEVEAIVDEILSQTMCKGHGEVSEQFDALFKGRLSHLFKVVSAALQAEYADFFDAWSGAAKGLLAKMAATPPAKET